ncbi:single-stranded DNA-binding protein, partial [Microcoleus sp. HI-ES]|nr:single-stranded DNA-binding protein [Microcoleus sp. HI-ES]MCZ0903132.1 single-stranded DNA-binding protein [Microcoleus sp. HI-ES]
IAERGVQLVGTAHGNRIENLMKNPTLADLIGGIQAVTLGDDEARRRGSQKTVLERKAPPTFEIAIEMLERQRWVIHERVADSIDTLLRGREPSQQIRSVSETGEVIIEQESATPPARFPGMAASSSTAAVSAIRPVTPISGWRSAGKMVPMPAPSENFAAKSAPVSETRYFEQLLEESLSVEPVPKPGRYSHNVGPNGEDLPLHVYPYGIPRHQLEQVISTLNLPVLLTKDIESADVVLALRSNVRNQSKLRHLAKTRQVPVHTIKAATIPHVARALRRLLDMDDPGTPEVADLALFARSGSSDELEALEETRLAVEQIVIPKGQPVELLPRSPNVRKMQHELVEHYHLKSHSFGEEPNRRLRIYPA